MTSNELPRHYHVWDAGDYRVVIAGCLEELTDEQVARKAGRTVAAVRDRAEYFVTYDPADRRAPWSRLREELAVNPDYDWETIVRGHHAREQLPYWDEDGDKLLAQAWALSASGRAPARWLRGRDRRGNTLRMPQLEEALGIHEFEIFRRLRYLGLATDAIEVVARLGAGESGALAARARMLSDRLSVTVHVLMVTDESGGVLHTSVHPSREAALAAKDECTDGFANHPLAVWTICGRSIGDGVVGDKMLTGTFETAAQSIVDLDLFDS